MATEAIRLVPDVDVVAVVGERERCPAEAEQRDHLARRELGRQEEHVPDASPFSSPVALGFTVIFLLSVPAAFVSPYLAIALWLSTMALRYPLRRLAGMSPE